MSWVAACTTVPQADVALSDSPFTLVTAALQSIPVLTNTQKTGFDFTLYTGDIVSHDAENQLSRYVSTYGHERFADAVVSNEGTTSSTQRL